MPERPGRTKNGGVGVGVPGRVQRLPLREGRGWQQAFARENRFSSQTIDGDDRDLVPRRLE